MKQQDFGRIINIASAHGLVASVHGSAYVAAKHGLVGVQTKHMSRWKRRSGISPVMRFARDLF